MNKLERNARFAVSKMLFGLGEDDYYGFLRMADRMGFEIDPSEGSKTMNKKIKDWDIVFLDGEERVSGWIKAPKDPRPNVCTIMIDAEIVSSAIEHREGKLMTEACPGDLLTTRTGSIYELSGPRRRKVFSSTSLLSVGGPEWLAVQKTSRSRSVS